MSVSMSTLVNDAKELVMRLKEREKNVDQAVIQSNALAKKVDAIQQLESELLNINEKANHRSKVAVLSSIQKENKVIKLLQQENEDLKESLEEHQSVLELIMTKYRQQMLQLILLKKQQEISEQYHYANLVKSLQEKTDKIAEMSEVMRTAVELDEKHVNEQEELIQSLIVENRGLKELLRIRARYGVKDEFPTNPINQTNPTTTLQETMPSSATTTSTSTNQARVDREVQTDPIETDSSFTTQVSPARPPQPANTQCQSPENTSALSEVSSPFKLDPPVSPSGKKSISPSSSPVQMTAHEEEAKPATESKDASSPPRLSVSPAKVSTQSKPSPPADRSPDERPSRPTKDTTTASPAKTEPPSTSAADSPPAQHQHQEQQEQKPASPSKTAEA